MTFVVSGKLTIDASQGKSELAQVKAAKDKVTASTKDLGAADAKAAIEVRKLGAQAEAAAAKGRMLSREEARIASEAVTLGRSHKLAAGQVGNLTAQFNDIGVMMAAGQNPFQLAIQQGTQITQVIGPMGAAGAAKALKSALVSMVSPMTLITIGSIAAGAAMVNWLTGASEDAETLEDQLEAVGQAIDTFSEKAAQGRLSTAELIQEFGKASPELRLVLADMAALAKIDAQKAIDTTAKSVRGLILELSWWDARSSVSAAQDFLGLGSIGSAAREAGSAFARNLELLDSNEDAATRLAAALDVREQLLQAAGGLDNLNETQREFYEGLAAIIRDLEVFAGALQAPWNELKETGADLWSSLTSNAEAYFAKRLQIETQSRDQVAQLRLEEEVQLAILQHGEGSIEVAELRLRAEREAFEQQVDSRDVSEDLKAELMEAWDAANGVASVDMAGNISLAADEAHRLTVNLMKAQGQELMGRVRANPDFNDPRGESRGAGNADYIYQSHDLPDVDMPSNPRTKRKSKGGASAYDKERKALERLIAREEEQLAILRETDPVQQEMIRLRDELKNATDEEREAIEALIRERIKEQRAIADTDAATGLLRENSETLVEGLIRGGEDAADAWDQVKASIAAAALEALILGDGPLGNLFGLGASDGNLGGLAGLALSAIGLADGDVDIGTVYGHGGNKDDKVHRMLSPGETVVHAKATRKYRPLLQAMNDGVEIPGLASGGEVPGGAATGSGGSTTGGAGEIPYARVVIQPSPLFQSYVEEVSGKITVEGIQDYDRNTAPETARRALNDPHGIG
ncbi:phage tail length tape measure family protein [Pseudophaeobacter sp.]|uniref:phage tail length tape measure family protein n=1 Tax=Pseudophaeobacter sp. TaxID=1971739 RepID=UPI00329823D7